MRSVSAVICAAAAILAIGAGRPSDDKLFMRPEPTKSKHKAGPTTLKGYALGMTLAALKQRPSPDNVNGPTRLACSDDPAMQTALGPALTPKYQGETVCGFQLLRSRDWELGGLMLDASHGAAVVFHFFGGRLMQIESEEDAELSDVILHSLTTQYGEPAQINKKVAQSLKDEVHTQVVVTWVNGSDGIVMTAPKLGTDRMSVVYSNLPWLDAMRRSSGNIL